MAPDTLKKSKLTLAITLTSLTKSGGLNLYLGFDRNYSITSVQIMFYGFISIVFFFFKSGSERKEQLIEYISFYGCHKNYTN